MRIHGKKTVAATLAVVGLTAAACGSGSSSSGNDASGTDASGAYTQCTDKPNTCNSGKPKSGGSFTYTIEKTVNGWNVNSSNSNTFDIAEAMTSVAPPVFSATPDLKPALNTEIMDSATDATSGGVQTLTYKFKQSAKWNDGVPMGYDDLKYQWDTNNTGADHCPKCTPASTGGYDDIASMTSQDNGQTVVVKMVTPYADWRSMFSNVYPAHVAVKHGGDTPAGRFQSFSWLDKTVPTYSGGPFIISKYNTDQAIQMVPNQAYGGTKPSLSSLTFRIITDQTQEIPALQNNEVQAIYPQPNADIVAQAKKLQGTQYHIGKGLQWEHLDFNTVNGVLKDKQLRTAIFTAISRDDIIKRTIGQFLPDAKPMNNHMFVNNQDGYQDNVGSTGQGSGNLDKAKSLLKDAGYTGIGSSLKSKSGQAVSIRCTYTVGNVLRQQTCQVVQSQLQKIGVTVKITPTDDLGGTLDKGDFDLILFAWVNNPYVATGAQQIWTLKGGNDYGKNDDPAAEAKITAASKELDATKRNALLNDADKLITADAYSLPLFQKPTFLVARSNFVNIRDNATLLGPPYNTQEWGAKS